MKSIRRIFGGGKKRVCQLCHNRSPVLCVSCAESNAISPSQDATAAMTREIARMEVTTAEDATRKASARVAVLESKVKDLEHQIAVFKSTTRAEGGENGANTTAAATLVTTAPPPPPPPLRSLQSSSSISSARGPPPKSHRSLLASTGASQLTLQPSLQSSPASSSPKVVSTAAGLNQVNNDTNAVVVVVATPTPPPTDERLSFTYETGYKVGYNAAKVEGRNEAREEARVEAREEAALQSQVIIQASLIARAAAHDAFVTERERASTAEARLHDSLYALKTAEAMAQAAIARTEAAERGAEAARTWAALAARRAADEAEAERAVARAATTDAAAACANAQSMRNEIEDARVRVEAAERLYADGRMHAFYTRPFQKGSEEKKSDSSGDGGGRALFAPLSMASVDARERADRAASARLDAVRELQSLSSETGFPTTALAAALRLPRGAGTNDFVMREVVSLLRTLRAEGGLPPPSAFASVGWPDGPALMCHCAALKVFREGTQTAAPSASLLTRSDALNRWALVSRADAANTDMRMEKDDDGWDTSLDGGGALGSSPQRVTHRFSKLRPLDRSP